MNIIKSKPSCVLFLSLILCFAAVIENMYNEILEVTLRKKMEKWEVL